MKPRLIYSVLITFSSLSGVMAQEQPVTKDSFAPVNLNYSGLEKVKNAYTASKYDEAAKELLKYYREKSGRKGPDFSNAEKIVDNKSPLDKATKMAADSALIHHFQPQKGYGFFDYGKDINWQFWPVKDNEVRWQLHRVKWWQSMALAYNNSKNEKYAKEWMLQFADWAKKNPLGLSEDNDRYAWRPLEVSDRLQSLVPTFAIFINSPQFSPQFLMYFLNNYHEQAKYLPTHYAAEGNHRLFEAQRELFAGTSFPEFTEAAAWRKSGIEVLNAEIQKQVYPDGVQYELSPVYHAGAIDIFLNAYRTAQKAAVANEFPETYKQTVEKMIMAFISITFPNYNQPMFGDSWLADKKFRIQQFQSWLDVFPKNDAIRYFATDGKEGKRPDFLSKGLSTAGFYTFRNGWSNASTIMILKASPPGEFHAQPDNGTFELWVNGRNFTPDAGCYVYSGDEEITKKRNWYRQTRVHSTLTLNNQNMVITKAQQNKWETGKNLDVLTYTNPSYADLSHQRSVLFIDQKYFLIIDEAIGKATGNLGVHFQLKEDSKPVFDKSNNKVYTTYSDGNNLLIQSLNAEKVNLNEEEGKVSYLYNQEMPRPAFVFEKPKSDIKTQSFVSIVYPFDGDKAPEITVKENAGNQYEKGIIDLTFTINGKKSIVKTSIK
ncbi:heparin-sulfate lyase HepC [Pedobacter roseus]|uniref:Heparinase II/III family protein n=1 Tax=Pedobacter roseus TaxID=336820 RepID=A0A7G9QAL4_9SPHI|nr:heparin-sulfate lyase HepC [Pedobacter roseus]QNN40389.1 heparinase II/III family protein [Pedobacter roseus]